MAKERNSSVELLRLTAMMTIVAVHYLGNNDLDSLLTAGISLNGELYALTKLLLNYGVNLFVLITGYYMCDRTTVSLRKAVKLLVDVAFYGAVMYALSLAVGLQSFSVTGLVKAVLPLLFGYRWFVKAYLVLYLLVPFLSRLVQAMDEKTHRSLIVVSMVLFSVWPTLLPNPPIDDYGFGFVNFIQLFVIAAYIRRYLSKPAAGKCWAGLAVCSLCTLVILSLGMAGIELGALTGYALAHNSPLNLVACSCLFLLAVNRSFCNRWINLLASGAFAVYLIHGDPNTMKWMFNALFHAESFQAPYIWLPHMLAVTAVVYPVCFAADLIKSHTVDIAVNKVMDRIGFINRQIG